MRIPFDLIAAILCIDRLGASSELSSGIEYSTRHVFGVWLAFLFLSWCAHELVARLTESRTSFGMSPDGGGSALHPIQFHGRCAIAAQVFCVTLFALAAWHLNWPAMVSRWPTWIGLSPDATIARLELGKSVFMGTFIAIAPYMFAMVLSWLPRRRLASGARRRAIPLIPYLSFEAKLSWMPLSLCALVALLGDASRFLPATWTSWLDSDFAQFFLLVGTVVFGAAILVPLAAVSLWKCEKLPEGVLKERLEMLMARSGVKARAVLVWGGRGTGILNACVMGPWAKFRYVLISPLLTDELTLEETEAVLGHELGHARYGHLTFYFVILLGMSALLALFALLPQALTQSGALKHLVGGPWKGQALIEAALTLGFMIAYIYFVFGALSRMCEREADLASAELLGTPEPLCSALEKIAWMNGNMRRVPCWHHGSIAERIDAVQALSTDPEAIRKFHERQKKIRVALTALTLALIAALLVFYSRM